MSPVEVASGVRPRKSADDLSAATAAAAVDTSTTTTCTTTTTPTRSQAKTAPPDDMVAPRWRARLRSPWSCSVLTFSTTVLSLSLALLIVQSFLTRQLDPKGAAMSYMRPAFAKFSDFDTEHTRFATKYSLYLYREGGIDEDTRVKGIPVLFIPGNAGSYKQVRPLAAQAAVHFHDVLQHDAQALQSGKRPLDFFSVDFNEDITAFHGQTLVEQAEYLNEAVAYILSLYHNPARSLRDPELPDPTSVILVGHSMGGIVARTMLTMPNYQPNTINTIITLAAPHARAPISFDADIVNTYTKVNNYWREAYSQKWSNDNPLWHVTTISIAGGGLDTIVPSDYATLASLVPPTHGFTVFTSTIPRVWTSMDHLAITWCDQLRKVIIPALYDVVDAGRPNQTRPRAERMQAFKKRLLTGMEDVAEPELGQHQPHSLLTLSDKGNTVVPQGERLVLRKPASETRPKTYIMPIPPQGSPGKKRFTLLTSQEFKKGAFEVFLCSVHRLVAGQTSEDLSLNMDLASNGSGTTRLACKDASHDQILLPASYESSRYSFDDVAPFAYLQYNLEDLADHQFVAVIDKRTDQEHGSLVAEFSSKSETGVQTKGGFFNMLLSGIDITLPAERALVNEIKIPSLHSSLLAYNLDIEGGSCGPENPAMFSPLVRQHIANPYESKFFVNARHVEVSMHGLAPYMPPSLLGQSESAGLALQIWADPTCQRPIELSMRVDIIGSLGKLWMRYRVVFAAFPLLVVALVLRKQFRNYDNGGFFMSFTESMDHCLRSSVPVLLAGLTMLAMSLSQASQSASARAAVDDVLGWRANATENAIDFTINDLLLGSQDPFFWFLVPLFGFISIGVCIVLNYVVLILTQLLSVCFAAALHLLYGANAESRINDTFTSTSIRKRIVTTVVLLLLVASLIPYQFVFVVLCLVQVATCIRALTLARTTHSSEHINFYNYTHSILLLMLWILPINIPVLVVWIHNLAVHYLTPFSSHHNILSITPFVLLVETLSSGNMVPRVHSWIRHLTNVLFFALAVYAAVYGVTFAYLLHVIVNIIFAWLTGIHLFGGSASSSISTRSNSNNSPPSTPLWKRIYSGGGLLNSSSSSSIKAKQRKHPLQHEQRHHDFDQRSARSKKRP